MSGIKQCTAKTRKKAWNNPLAPLARCSRKATPGSEFCACHERKAQQLERENPRWRRESMRGGR